jgi:hypothetical protein
MYTKVYKSILLEAKEHVKSVEKSIRKSVKNKETKHSYKAQLLGCWEHTKADELRNEVYSDHLVMENKKLAKFINLHASRYTRQALPTKEEILTYKADISELLKSIERLPNDKERIELLINIVKLNADHSSYISREVKYLAKKTRALQKLLKLAWNRPTIFKRAD